MLALLLGCLNPTPPFDSGEDSGGVDTADDTAAENLELGAVVPCAAPAEPGWALGWGGVDMGASQSPNERLIEPGSVGMVGERLFVAAPDGGVASAAWRSQEYVTPTDWTPIVGGFSVAELDGDGLDDLLLLGQAAGLVPDAERPGADETALLFEPMADGFVRDMVPADFDGDGLTDLFIQFTATGVAATSLRPVLALNRGGGSFVSTLPVDAGDDLSGSAGDAMALDADADGDADVLVCHDDGTTTPLQLLVNEGGSFLVAPADTFATTGACRSLALGALGSEGRPTVVATFSDRVERWEPEGEGWALDPALAIAPAAPEARFWASAPGDLDNDGDVDLVVGEAEAFTKGAGVHPVWLLWNDGADYRAEEFLEGGFPRGVLLRDLNADGMVDIVIGDAEWTPGVYLSTGCGAGSWLEIAAPAGTRARVEAAGVEVASGVVASESGSGSAASAVLHVGLGAVTTIDRLTLYAPDGTERVVDGPLEPRRVVRWHP